MFSVVVWPVVLFVSLACVTDYVFDVLLDFLVRVSFTWKWGTPGR